MKKIKFLVSHIVICLILFFGLSMAKVSSSTYSIYFVLIVLAYLTSGYLYTNKQTKTYEYFMVFFTGIFFWLICFIISPSATQSWGWFFYQFYIIGITPFFLSVPSIEEFINNEGNYTIASKLVVLFILPGIFSLFQYIGGRYRKVKISKNNGG